MIYVHKNLNYNLQYTKYKYVFSNFQLTANIVGQLVISNPVFPPAAELTELLTAAGNNRTIRVYLFHSHRVIVDPDPD